MNAGNLTLRIASALVLAGIAAVGAYFGGVVAGVVVAAAVTIVHLEWTGVTEGAIGRALLFTLCSAAAVFVLGVGYPSVALVAASLLVIAAAWSKLSVWRPLGVFYCLMLGLSILLLRGAGHGFEAIVFLLAVVTATDTGAYFAGRTIGGPKLWPAVSPKKTWAGAIGGVVAAVAVGLAALTAMQIPVRLDNAVTAFVLSLACQCGDLFESFVKRSFGVKDSGHLIPGHGGLMDRVDGLAFAAVAAVLIGLARGGMADLGGGLLLW